MMNFYRIGENSVRLIRPSNKKPATKEVGCRLLLAKNVGDSFVQMMLLCNLSSATEEKHDELRRENTQEHT